MTTTEIVFILLVGGVAAVVKSIAGMGYPLILLPVLALFLDVADAVVIVAPSNLFLNLTLVYSGRGEWSNSTTLPRFLSGAVAGAVCGSLLLHSLPNNLLRGALVLIIVVFLMNQFRSTKFELSEQQGLRLAPGVGAVAGLFHGAAAISGPVVTPWFLSLGLTRAAFIFSVSSVFTLAGLVQIVVFAIQGVFTMELFLLSIALVPLSQLVFPIGNRIGDRVSVETFRRLVMFLLAVSAVSLVVRMF